jgi:hypothetical protein
VQHRGRLADAVRLADDRESRRVERPTQPRDRVEIERDVREPVLVDAAANAAGELSCNRRASAA